MAAEWGAHGIQANAIGPGYMLTDMNEALISNPEFDAWVRAAPPPAAGAPRGTGGHRRLPRRPRLQLRQRQIIYVDGGMISVL
jgi:gluconate 5-dehydrogenase